MPGFDPEERQTDISGDPPPQRPLTKRQMQGAQQAAVNRTQLPTAAQDKPGAGGPATPSGQQAQELAKEKKNGQQPGGDGSTPFVSGAQQAQRTWQSEADAALQYEPSSFNPAHPIDWLKSAVEAPVETYFMGRHVWHALDAFYDPNALSESLFEIQQQSDARTTMLAQTQQGRQQLAQENMMAADNPQLQQLISQAQQRQAQKAAGTLQRPWQDDMAAAFLDGVGDPRYVPLLFGGARGAMLVARMLGPSIGNAIFEKNYTGADAAWGLIPAMVFGGKLPPSVEAKLVEAMPGAEGLIRRFGASQAAKAETQKTLQDNQKLIGELMKTAQPEYKRLVAEAFREGMKVPGDLDLERLEKRIMDSLEKKGGFNKAMLDEFATMKPEEAVGLMVKAGLPERLIAKAWTYGWKMPYDLIHLSPAEPALHWWTDWAPALNVDRSLREKFERGWQWTAHMVNQSALGASGHAGAPEASHWRSLLGHDRTNQLVAQQWETHLRDVAGDALKDPQQVDDLYSALEGDVGKYYLLKPEMRYVADSMRLVAAGLRKTAGDSGYSYDFVHNFWPRVPALVRDGKFLRPMGRGGDVLLRQAQRHRALGVKMVDYLTEQRAQIQQRYKTVGEANAAQGRLREAVSRQILDGTPLQHIEAVRNLPQADWDAIERIRSIATEQPELAKAEAQRYAEQIAPDFSMNPFDSMRKISGYLRSITSHTSVQNLLNTSGKDGKALAVLRPINDDRAMNVLRGQGYVAIGVSGFDNVLVTKPYAELLQRATHEASSKSLGAAGRLLDIERTAVGLIMYSPRIHGMNMAARLGMMGMLHPLEVTRWFKEGLIQKPGVTQISPEEYRMEAWNAGVLPPKQDGGFTGLKGGEWADRANSVLGNLSGDVDFLQTPLIRDMSGSNAIAKASSGARAVLGKVRDLAWGRQSDLWSWVSDFGVMAYHLEKEAALDGGISEEDATLYAARRANSWMGHVAPEDTNPSLHALAKTAAFAPNWWRTWAELLTGVYRRSGLGWTPDVIRYVVQNEVKTAMAAVAFQQLTANALNLLLSGHTIYQNDPGNWGKVEITAPWAIAALNAAGLGIDPKTGRDAKGRKLTMENPLARQTVDTEQAFGLLTSAPHWSPESMRQGASAFAAGRESPVLQGLFALTNIDLYRSISSDGLRYVDPTHDTPFGNPQADLATAALDLTPMAQIAQQMQQAIIQDQGAQDINGPFGLKIPKVVADSLGPTALGGDALKMLLVGMTGVNPPYMRSSKSFGVSPTDDEYKRVHDEQTQYQQNMTALSTSTLSGQMAPYQWLAAYRQLAQQHSDEMRHAFKDAPEYNDGPLGLAASWEGLYDQAKDKTGVLDADKLRTLQREWRANHSSADYSAVQSELRVNDQKYPMLSLYHKSLDAYDNWQVDWCKANGISVEQIRQDMTGWAQVYNDRNASRQYLAAHPEISQFEAAKKSEFESGQSKYGLAGLMYALFFNPSAADRFMTTSGETPAQVEQEVQQQQVPPAP